MAPPMVEREMVTMIVDTLPVFYYEKLVGYMPSSFVDLVFVRERIEVGLKRGKFDYISPVGGLEQQGQRGRREMLMSSLQRLCGPSRRKPPMIPINIHNITRASWLAPGALPTQRPPSQGRPLPHRGGPSGFGSNPASPGQ